MTAIVEVTQADIDAGKRCDCQSCPIAIAVGRHFAPTAFATVTPGSIHVYRYGYGATTLRADTPPEAAEWLTRFDNGEPVRPITFPLTFTPIAG